MYNKQASIQEENGSFVLYTSDRKRVLGRHKTREDALAQERAVQASKHLLAKQADFSPDYTAKELKDLGTYEEVYGEGKHLASMKEWPARWINPQDPKGWLQWYERYSEGRRTPDDERQIKRWNSFKARHGAQLVKNPTPRRAFALQHWAIDPLKLVEDKKNLEKRMNNYKQAEVLAHLIKKAQDTKVEDAKPGYPLYTNEGQFQHPEHGQPCKDYKELKSENILSFLDKEKKKLKKKAVELEMQQHPETAQVTRKKTAVIIKGDPEFVDNNPKAYKFYNELAAYLRTKDYAVTTDKGAPSENFKDIPPTANLWIGHSRGTNRLQYAPKGTKTLMLGSWRPGAINHPLDDQSLRGVEPNLFHYVLTDEMKKAIDKKCQ